MKNENVKKTKLWIGSRSTFWYIPSSILLQQLQHIMAMLYCKRAKTYIARHINTQTQSRFRYAIVHYIVQCSKTSERAHNTLTIIPSRLSTSQQISIFFHSIVACVVVIVGFSRMNSCLKRLAHRIQLKRHELRWWMDIGYVDAMHIVWCL